MTLEQLIEQARTEGKWLRIWYQDMWFTPDDLEKEIAGGRFNWCALDFQLLDPRQRLQQLKNKMNDAIQEYNKVLKMIEG